LGKEVKYMEIHKAEIVTRGDNKFLVLNLDEGSLEISLTEDDPKKVKSVFNKLLKYLKNGPFNFEFQDEANDLYVHISKEYITQLNQELTSVYDELEHYNLLNEEE